MDESSQNKHPDISEDTRSPAGYEWWNIPHDGLYGTWVDSASIIVQSDYTAQLAQEQSAHAAFGDQNMPWVGMEGTQSMDPSGHYGVHTWMEPSIIHYSAPTVPSNAAWSTATSWVAPPGNVHYYNDNPGKYLTRVTNDLSISY